MTDLDGLIREADLGWASSLMGLGPDGFAPVDGDDSRMRAMMNLETADFEACPGSGKTTLLLAKLAILALRWPYLRQGICVLSHTNAARDEIGSRLSDSAAGTALLRYPHFVGTIHSFVNEYLAIPWLRSKGIQVRCIDTHITLRRRFASLPWKTRSALERARLGPNVLVYTTPEHACRPNGRFGPETATYRSIVDAARRSSAEGYFCFDEMFVWATELLDCRPEVAVDLRRRFPMVFIDEAQDNSEDQSALLHRVFRAGDGPVRRQRFGDSNQAIYSGSSQSGAETDPFPCEPVHDIPRSSRFSQSLADTVKAFGVVPQSLVGVGPSRAHVSAQPVAPTIFLFDDASIGRVLPHFGDHLIAVFDETALNAGVFAAVAGVHHLGENGRLPQALGHYAAHYDPSYARKDAVPATFAQYLAKARYDMAGGADVHVLVTAVASALFAAAALVGAVPVVGAHRSPHRRLLGMIAGSQLQADHLALLEMVVSAQGSLDEATWRRDGFGRARAIALHLGGAAVLTEDALAFLEWPQPARHSFGTETGLGQSDNLFVHPVDAPRVRIRLGSIHSVKGETHTATLVLESFFHDHHLKELKPWLLGAKTGGSSRGPKGRLVREGTRMIGRLKLHYVAMTRPTHLLCLAMRADAFEDGELGVIETRGWTVVDCRFEPGS